MFGWKEMKDVRGGKGRPIICLVGEKLREGKRERRE